MTKRELFEENERLRDLLRKVQWRGGSYECVGCGAMHRDGCMPGWCDVDDELNQPRPNGVKSSRRPGREPPPTNAHHDDRRLPNLAHATNGATKAPDDAKRVRGRRP